MSGRGGNGGDGNYALYISESLECYTTLEVNTSKGGNAGGKGAGGEGGEWLLPDNGKPGSTDGNYGKGYSYFVTGGVIKGDSPVVN